MPDERLVIIVVFDGMKLLDLAGPAEVFAEANRFGANYRLVVASVDGHDVATSIGSPFAVAETVNSIESPDTVLVTGGDVLIGRPLDPALVDALAQIYPRCRRIASICTGAFLLAQAGVLDHRRATTHWRHTGLLQRAFPNISVDPDAIFVRDANVFTSAGVSAGIDLALALVEDDYGSDVVREVARSLVVYLKRAGGQSQFSVLVESAPPAGSALRPATDAIAADPGADHSVARLATRAALSTRQLTRLFHTELGTTPARYVEIVRIDAARGALDAGSTVSEAARIAGFGSDETLRRVFVSELGVSPKAYRDRFRTATR
ncbi:GlxA family transcriptional regulator [Mycobacteroides franklinii]|uniref:Helix-turn-helix domain-containing protein n=1 Tax=Mycobacteroides franklinii TaxID=948102 RepID=A0A4R5PD61_9MYCO|nr:DJ-1/PfpI family protein [Mycobacteroides franklinii]ORA64724.1 AraC family transcriptional regulator [Mycobacteroides franklinii]TDH22759.1 helix-turn-helix domain-containing protein [Mycobacteroides franklinii]